MHPIAIPRMPGGEGHSVPGGTYVLPDGAVVQAKRIREVDDGLSHELREFGARLAKLDGSPFRTDPAEIDMLPPMRSDLPGTASHCPQLIPTRDLEPC